MSRYVGAALYALVALLLAAVMLEGWLVILFAKTTKVGTDIVVEPAGWPKTLKSVLYISIFAVTLLKFLVDRSWNRLRTRADLALAVLGVVMVAAGLLAGSSALLIGQALFVYFRGAIVFYAWRALDPSRKLVKRTLIAAGAFVGFNGLIAVWQMLVGYPSFQALGWIDMTWARINRAHALFTHPNDLGHVVGLMLIGLLAWFAVKEKVGKVWWLIFGLLALGLAASQSRESMIAVVLGAVLIAILSRTGRRRLIAAMVLVIALGAAPLISSPANRSEWAYRLQGVVDAFIHPSGAEDRPRGNGSGDPNLSELPGTEAGQPCKASDEECVEIPPREIRVLYAQQGVELWVDRPFLGYGVGQFGGIVAFRDDPNWNMDPRFGPDGFDKHGFNAKTVDSFWLHLLVETGTIGAVAYLTWTYLLGAPFVRASRRRRAPADTATQPYLLWAAATVLFGAFVAILSPSLEDPLFPPIFFSILGIAWVFLHRMPVAADPAPAAVEPTSTPDDEPASPVVIPMARTSVVQEAMQS